MPYPDLLLRRQCLRILTGSSLAVIFGNAITNGNSGAFQTNVSTSDSAPYPAAQQTTQTTDWPDFLGPHRNGKSKEAIQTQDWTGGKLKLLWDFPLGDGYAIGSLYQGRFYQPHLDGQNETLVCLNADSGDTIWEESRKSDYRDMYGYDSGPRCSPVIHDGQVFLYGVDGQLSCRAISEGKLNWQRDLNDHYGVIQNFFGVGSTPVVCDDNLLVMVGGSPQEDKKLPPGALDRVSHNGSAMVAIRCKDGSEVYRGGEDLASYSSPILHDFGGKTLALAFCRGGLLGFDPTTGKQRFYYAHRSPKLESVNAATPVVYGNQILLSETYSVGSVLLEVDPNDWSLSEVWKDEPRGRNQSLQAHWNTPVLIDGHLYASSGRHTGNAELRCVEWATGKVQWSQPGLGRCSLTASANQLVVVGERGNLFLIEANPKKFSPITEHSFAQQDKRMRYPAWAAAVIADGKMFVRDAHRLFCFKI